MTVRQAFENFIISRQLICCTEKTITSYREHCKPFLDFIAPNTDINSLNRDLYNNYFQSLHKRSISQSTIATYTRSLKAFVHWIAEEYEIDTEYKRIKVPRTPKKVTHIYTDDEIALIFNSVNAAEEWIVARNQCILSLMLDSGLRRIEVCSLKRIDVNLNSNLMKLHGKGNKERIVPLGNFSHRLIERYNKLCPHEKEFLFVDIHGDPLTCNAVKLFIAKINKNLPFKLSAHILRHNFATNYCIDYLEQNNQVDIYSLMILMGHEDVSTTEKYLHFARQIIASKRVFHTLIKC